DTDQSRSTDEAIQAIIEGMRWVGLDWDEGPFRQTERMALYRQHALRLLEQGKAYWCVCTAEELDARRKDQLAKGLTQKYDGRCRGKNTTNPTGAAALRFKAPQEGQVVVEDLVKGRVVFESEVLDDLIILRSNGYPTYNFSVVVDDALMGITHVIRGDDHLTNTPRQVPMLQALGFPVPHYGHLPMILGSDRARLSKRHGATSVLAYRDLGYLPEAVLNYLVRLGWSHGDQEIFSLPELIENFSFDNVQKAAAVFNPEKLLWLNHQYIKSGDPKRIGESLLPYLDQAGFGQAARSRPEGWMAQAVLAVRERTKTFVEMVDWVNPYLAEDVEFEEAAAAKHLKPDAVPVLEAVRDRLRGLADLSKAS
ncbi:MAG: glutamate--tRNA ligase, partial [Nitrospirales bacterium]